MSNIAFQTLNSNSILENGTLFQSDYALRYKSGISAPRPTKKVSEYQKQFEWKSGMPASPRLSAEQVWNSFVCGLLMLVID